MKGFYPFLRSSGGVVAQVTLGGLFAETLGGGLHANKVALSSSVNVQTESRHRWARFFRGRGAPFRRECRQSVATQSIYTLIIACFILFRQ